MGFTDEVRYAEYYPKSLESIRNRRGKFYISRLLLERISIGDLMAIFNGIFIFHATSNEVREDIEMIAIGIPFDEIREGHFIPEYTCVLHTEAQFPINTEDRKEITKTDKENPPRITSVEWVRKEDA